MLPAVCDVPRGAYRRPPSYILPPTSLPTDHPNSCANSLYHLYIGQFARLSAQFTTRSAFPHGLSPYLEPAVITSDRPKPFDDRPYGLYQGELAAPSTQIDGRTHCT